MEQQQQQQIMQQSQQPQQFDISKLQEDDFAQYGIKFIQVYYKKLQEHTVSIDFFDTEFASLVWNASCFTGTENIKQFLSRFSVVHYGILSMDCQVHPPHPGDANSVKRMVCHVAGKIQVATHPKNFFSDSFYIKISTEMDENKKTKLKGKIVSHVSRWLFDNNLNDWRVPKPQM